MLVTKLLLWGIQRFYILVVYKQNFLTRIVDRPILKTILNQLLCTPIYFDIFQKKAKIHDPKASLQASLIFRLWM